MLPLLLRQRALALPAGRCFSSSPALASGHNKWSKIKQRKGIEDAKKSAIYGKAGRDIVVAVRGGGSADPEVNITLANILKKAKTSGVPKDVIERALTRAKGGKAGGSQPTSYEAMAYSSVGVVIECLTDNANRTSSAIREILSEHSARLAPVGFMFDRKGYVRITSTESPAAVERLLEDALMHADDFEQRDDPDTSGTMEIELRCPPQELTALTGVVSSHDVRNELLSSELIYSPLEPATGVDDEIREKVAELVSSLEENEDCVRVWTTLD